MCSPRVSDVSHVFLTCLFYLCHLVEVLSEYIEMSDFILLARTHINFRTCEKELISQIQGLFKNIQGHVYVMYQQIQGVITEEKGLVISKI
jgi:hypothetical protein